MTKTLMQNQRSYLVDEEGSNKVSDEKIDSILFEKQQISNLYHLLQKGIFTQSEYEIKVSKIEQIAYNASHRESKLSAEQLASIQKLQLLLNNEIITREEFERKKYVIEQNSNPEFENQVLQKLQHLLNKGIITITEFEVKKQILRSHSYPSSK